MDAQLKTRLDAFVKEHNFKTKGPLCVALVVTQHAKDLGLPLDAEALLTDKGGQVLGLGKNAVQTILQRHDIKRVLAEEGGRTSRGSISNMRAYVALLNQLESESLSNLLDIETYWVARVKDFFAAKPFKIRLDVSKSLRTLVRDVLSQAADRAKSTPGTHYAGAVLQHLVGAKLDCALGTGKFAHNSFSTSDSQLGRHGDFFIGNVAVHITTAPGEALIRKCKSNLDAGIQPIIVTLSKGLNAAEFLAENAGLGERIDVFEAEQFIALNIYELGKFESDKKRVAVTDIVSRYNQIIEDFETDPSLRIEFC